MKDSTLPLPLVNALSSCCLSTHLPSPHRQWAAIELVRTLAYRSKLRLMEQSRKESADLDGKIGFLFFSFLSCSYSRRRMQLTTPFASSIT